MALFRNRKPKTVATCFLLDAVRFAATPFLCTAKAGGFLEYFL